MLIEGFRCKIRPIIK